jgi:hypothetical protein
MVWFQTSLLEDVQNHTFYDLFSSALILDNFSFPLISLLLTPFYPSFKWNFLVKYKLVRWLLFDCLQLSFISALSALLFFNLYVVAEPVWCPTWPIYHDPVRLYVAEGFCSMNMTQSCRSSCFYFRFWLIILRRIQAKIYSLIIHI